MQRETFDTLREFLPDEIVDEIWQVHGGDQVTPRISIESQSNHQGSTSLVFPHVNNDEVDEDGKLQKNKNSLTTKPTLSPSDSQTAPDPVNPPIPEPSISDLSKTIPETETEPQTLYEWKQRLQNTQPLRLGNQSNHIHYGFDTFQETVLAEMQYFIFPVSLSEIKKLISLLRDIDTVFQGTVLDHFIPNFMLEHGEGDEVYQIERKVDYLVYFVIDYLQNHANKLTPKITYYHNSKLERIQSDLLKNPEFYKHFFTKEILALKSMSSSIDTPLTRMLKYYLLRLMNSLKDFEDCYEKIRFLVMVYFKDIPPQKTSLNITQHADLGNIIALIHKILQGEIAIKKQLLHKVNDLYEMWLYQKLVVHFNESGVGEKGLQDKIYAVVDKKSFGAGMSKADQKHLKDTLKSSDGKYYCKDAGMFREIWEHIPSDTKPKELSIGKGFLKEDSQEFDGETTLELETLSAKFQDWGYKIFLSFGGHNKNLAQSEILSHELGKLISRTVEHIGDIITTSELTPDFIVKIKHSNVLVGSIVLDAKFSKYPFLLHDTLDFAPVIKYYSELGKNFSTSEINNTFPFKVILLFPGDAEAQQIKELNHYFQRNTNIVAVPLMVGDAQALSSNLEYLEQYICEFITEIRFRKDLSCEEISIIPSPL